MSNVSNMSNISITSQMLLAPVNKAPITEKNYQEATAALRAAASMTDALKELPASIANSKEAMDFFKSVANTALQARLVLRIAAISK